MPASLCVCRNGSNAVRVFIQFEPSVCDASSTPCDPPDEPATDATSYLASIPVGIAASARSFGLLFAAFWRNFVRFLLVAFYGVLLLGLCFCLAPFLTMCVCSLRYHNSNYAALNLGFGGSIKTYGRMLFFCYACWKDLVGPFWSFYRGDYCFFSLRCKQNSFDRDLPSPGKARSSVGIGRKNLNKAMCLKKPPKKRAD